MVDKVTYGQVSSFEQAVERGYTVCTSGTDAEMLEMMYPRAKVSGRAGRSGAEV